MNTNLRGSFSRSDGTGKSSRQMVFIIKIMKTILLCCLIVLPIDAAFGQVSPSGDRLILYELDRDHGKFVLSTSFESPEKGTTSLVVIADTFSVQPSGSMCSVVMSNAYVLQTSVGVPPSNEVAQTKMLLDVYIFPFPKQTKLVFRKSVIDLPKVKIGVPGESNARIYEGDEALRQMKRMGMEPADDMDWKKATNR